MKKYSKRTRAQAAMMLSAVACGGSWTYAEMALAVGGGADAINLAFDTVRDVDPDDFIDGNWRAMWAEAEARIRSQG
jgi:hypothetical protein